MKSPYPFPVPFESESQSPSRCPGQNWVLLAGRSAGLRVLAMAGRTSWAMLATTAVLLFATNAARASGNILLNADFSLNNGQAIPTDWTYFKAANVSSGTQDYWIVNMSSAGCGHLPAQSAEYYWKQWFIYNGTNNVAGLYQTFSSSPGAIYQASGWLSTSSCDQFGANCATWLQVEFLDATSKLVGLYKSAIFTASVGADTWFQFPVTNACDLSQPVSVGDPYFTTYAVTGSVSQLVAPAGTALVRYRFCYLTYGGQGGSAFMDSPVLDQMSGPAAPAISGLFPQDTMIFVNPTNGISFNVSSPSGFIINNSGIHLMLNGTDVSGSLAISGSASSKNVAYSGLVSNSAYTASINVSDVSNLTVNATIQFQTMWFGLLPPTYLWEAEDWDFTNGMYIDFPDLCNAIGDPNCYFGKVGVPSVDENNLSGASGPYRPGDLMGTLGAGDALRPTLYAAGRTDYRIDPFITTEWVNYTRDWPNSTNWVIGRISANLGDSGSLTLSLVNPDMTTTALGTFSINGGLGYSAFENIYLKDTNGNKALVVLNGKQTLQVSSGGNLLPNFFMLVQAEPDLPALTSMYPTGTRPFEPTNSLSFTAATYTSTFPPNSIHVTLDGIDVSSNLVITGSGSTNYVTYPNLLSNATHLAIITLTNSLGHGVAVTNQFDTFSENNYMVETEDFDYGGGQFISPWYPDCYEDPLGPYPAMTNIDYQHTTLNGEVFKYRAVGIPQDVLGPYDYLRLAWQNSGAIDYVLVFFAGGDWANYTRNYPPGSYYAYIRTSGDGPFSMYLDQVVSGAGTTNQVTHRLGHFGGVGKNYTTYGWVPLTDDGLAAPSVVKLGGVSTLRLTTAGNCNPNFFMLIPAGGITLTVKLTANNRVLSFPTQAGVAYRVFYRTKLTSGNWTLLTPVLGTGAVVSVSDPATDNLRFYQVTAP